LSVAFATKVIRPETTHHATPPSEIVIDHELAQIQENASSFHEHGPHPFVPSAGDKRKADPPIDIPCYHCRFAWSDSPLGDQLSPAALHTETAPPLASPPAHLLNDPVINITLHSLSDAIKVETPFDVDELENLLVDHLNQPFVQSVMKGL
jgi:hypothetical protein